MQSTRFSILTAFTAVVFFIASCGTKDPNAVVALASFDACSCATVKDANSEDFKKCKQLREADAKFEADFQQCAMAQKSGLDTNQVKFGKMDGTIKTTDDGTYNFDVAKSKITWRGEKITGKKHTGSVQVKSGSFTMANGALTAGEIVVDMNSIKVEGEDAGSAAKLETHLKSDDFFSAAKFGAAKYVIKSATANSSHSFNVTGMLTIKGITKEITSVMTIAPSTANAVIGGSLIFDRSEFDVRYGSDKFFDNLGNDMIKNEVILTFDLNAVK